MRSPETTVLYLFPPKPKQEPVFRVVWAGREVNRWVFEEVCLAKGRPEAERELCTALARKYHARVADTALAAITSCDDAAKLKEWALAAADPNDSEFLRLLGGG